MLKSKRICTRDHSPVFQKGLCYGLFKPPKTRTEYQLDSFTDNMEWQANMIIHNIDGLSDKGKSYSHVCFNTKNDAEYFEEKILNFSR